MQSFQKAFVRTAALRPMAAADLGAILALERLSFDADAFEDAEIYLQRFEQFPDGCFVIEEDGIVVGFLSTELWSVAEWTEELFEVWPEDVCCHHPDGHTLYISSIAVHPDYRNRGLASFLLSQALHQILFAREDIDQIALTVAEGWHPARQLYRRHGFEETLHLRRFFGGTSLSYHDGILMTVRRDDLARRD